MAAAPALASAGDFPARRGPDRRGARGWNLLRVALRKISLGIRRTARPWGRTRADGSGRNPCSRARRHSAWLDTFSFQARGFYEKLGYEEFGRLDYPPGHHRHFLRKRLTSPE